MTRVRSRDSNIISVDFRPHLNLRIDHKTQILFADTAVCLIRITYYLNGQPIGVQHVTTESPPR